MKYRFQEECREIQADPRVQAFRRLRDIEWNDFGKYANDYHSTKSHGVSWLTTYNVFPEKLKFGIFSNKKSDYKELIEAAEELYVRRYKQLLEQFPIRLLQLDFASICDVFTTQMIQYESRATAIQILNFVTSSFFPSNRHYECTLEDYFKQKFTMDYWNKSSDFHCAPKTNLMIDCMTAAVMDAMTRSGRVSATMPVLLYPSLGDRRPDGKADWENIYRRYRNFIDGLEVLFQRLGNAEESYRISVAEKSKKEQKQRENEARLNQEIEMHKSIRDIDVQAQDRILAMQSEYMVITQQLLSEQDRDRVRMLKEQADFYQEQIRQMQGLLKR